VTTRRFSLVACALWLCVATSPALWWINTDDWLAFYTGSSLVLLSSYTVYSLVLLSAAAVTAAVSISVSRNALSAPVARLGVALTVIGVCTTIVAWALPFWMGSIALGYGVLAIGVPKHRRGLASLAVAQLLGLITVVVGTSVGIGTLDEWGDHPVAQSAGLATAALLTIGSLVLLTSDARRSSSDGHSLGPWAPVAMRDHRPAAKASLVRTARRPERDNTAVRQHSHPLDDDSTEGSPVKVNIIAPKGAAAVLPVEPVTERAHALIRAMLGWLRWLALIPIVPAVPLLFFGLLWSAAVQLIAGSALLALSSLIWMLFDRE
jgi:hypothetical protein